MTKQFLLNGCLITGQQIFPQHALEISDGKITAIYPMHQLPDLPTTAQQIDLQGAYVSAGLIDTHIHGYGGFGAEQNTAQALLKLSQALLATGVTAFCPTLYAAGTEELLHTLSATVPAFGKETGAHLLGYHLEGPFLSARKRGVMKQQDLLPIDLNLMERLWQVSNGHISSMTVAPELPNLDRLVLFCKAHHILLQAGHTDATYEQFMRGVRLGITHTTHLFNAMSPLHHRALGTVGAVLIHPNLSAEIIADGVHIAPELVGWLRHNRPIKNLILITDALQPTGQAHGPFIANGEEVQLQDGAWRRVDDGVLAGSSLTMWQGVKNLTAWGYTLPQALACACENPARLLGLAHKGRIAVGMDADLIVFDKELHLLRVLSSHQTL